MARKDSWIRGSLVGVGAILALALVLMVNILGARYYQRLDWTASSLYTLSGKSLSLLEGLDREIDVVVFLDPENELYAPMLELLRRYEAASSKVRVRLIDSLRNPLEAQSLVDQYQIERQDVVVLAAGDDRRVVDTADLMEMDFEGGRPRVSGFKGEEAISSAILELTEARKPTLVYTTGHGERSLEDPSVEGLSELRLLLGKDNFTMAPWASMQQATVPEGTDLVIIAGAQTRFLDGELAALGSYLDGGGRLFLLLDPEVGEEGATGLGEWLGGYGVEAVEDLAVDPLGRVPYFSDETFTVERYAEHPITRVLQQARAPVLFSVARSVRAAEDGGETAVTELVFTSAQGWGERDLAAPIELHRDPGDTPGPVPLAVAVEDPRMVIIGSSALAANGMLPNGNNAAFLNNALNWLVQRETLLGIPPKEPEQLTLNLTAPEARRLTWLLTLGLPALAVAVGFVVLRRRRR